MRTTTILSILLLFFLQSIAQDVNPFESIGKEGKILTLSKGKYLEIENNDSLQRIGSVIVNMNTGQLYEILDTDTLYQESDLNPTIITRWWSIDPLAAKYPNMSPYAAMANNPIIYKDVDGRDFEIVIDDVNHTITIKATYYTAEDQFTNDVVSRALNDINQKNFLVKTSDGISYTLSFNLTLGNNSNYTGADMSEKAKADNSANYVNAISSNVVRMTGTVYNNGDVMYKGAVFGETLLGGDDMTLSNGKGTGRSGEISMESLVPSMKNLDFKYWIAIHEILHSLGVCHEVMSKDKEQSEITIGVMLSILSYASRAREEIIIKNNITLPGALFDLKNDIVIPYNKDLYTEPGPDIESADYPKVVYTGGKKTMTVKEIKEKK